ncbi:unnamed protein product, partial [Arctogadus glacialis]
TEPVQDGSVRDLLLLCLGASLAQMVFRCPACTAERQALCPPPTDTCTEIVREPGCGRCPVCARQKGDFCGGVRAEVLRRSALLPANPTGSYRWSSWYRARGCAATRWTRSPPLGARTPPGSTPAAVSDWTAPVVSSSINV